MIMKKFQGRSREEALDLAIKELGPDVVEMNLRPVESKGLFGFLKPKMVEVTVGLEEEPLRNREADNISEAIAGVRKVAEASLKKEEPKNVKSALETLTEASNRVNAGTYTKEQIVKPKAPETVTRPEEEPEKAPSKSSVMEDKLDNLHEMLEQQLLTPKAKEEEDAIEDTSITSSHKKEKKESSREVEKFIKLLYNTMIDNEVDEKYANQIIAEMEKVINPNTPFEAALATTYQRMILKFGNPVGITPAEHGPKMVFFVGPTGVGKTTTIAKLAAKFNIEGGKKVALLTADTYRIAAAEQLKSYADILGIPFKIIYSSKEVEQALRDFKDYDYIMVDTAGHSHQNVEQKEAMNGFIHSVDGIVEKEVFLVLSATTKYRDLLSIADTYSELTDYKLIFTKLDETTTLGSLLNVKLYTGASLSYITCGQNVPNDIESFNPQKTVKQLLGGRK